MLTVPTGLFTDEMMNHFVGLCSDGWRQRKIVPSAEEIKTLLLQDV